MNSSLTKAITLAAICCFPVANTDGDEFSASQLNHFERSIRPVLVQHCIECHGPQRQESELRLDSRESILKGGTRGPAINLTSGNESLILSALKHDGDLAMPPENQLDKSIVANFARWIRQGAAWPPQFELPAHLDPTQHWAFQPIFDPPVPQITNPNGPTTTIDAFIHVALANKDLTPANRADKHTLARRVYQDLTGLPPTLEQLNQYLQDDQPDAYEKLVDTALASPQFGVHWARMWMDVARYADNKGYIFYLNREFKWAFTYRDYLIESFNEDRSFQQMILEQLAADQLVTEDQRPLRAMGFVTLGDYFVNNKYDMIDDRIDVITRGLMGLTVTCARCHDHKYDPIPTADYYGIYGVLDSSHDPIVPPLYEAPPESPEYDAFLKALATKKNALDDFVNSAINNLKEDGRTRIADYLIAAYNERNNPDSDNFMLLTDKGALNPRMIRRWKNHLKDERADEKSIWAIWHRFAELKDDEFSEKVSDIYQQVSAQQSEFNSIIAEHVLTSAPTSMQEIAQRYQQALLHVKTVINQPGVLCDDPEILQIASSMYGPTAPADIPVNIGFDFLDLFPDRATQGEFKKVLEDVEKFIRNDAAAPPRALVLHDNESPTEPYVFQRGNPNNRGPYVPRKFLSLLDPTNTPYEQGSGRLELAHQIASPQNPLTARVMVNRIWAQLFGRGIVATPSDFGIRGAEPTHPELLDHLATHFIKNDWSIKTTIKQIVMSQTYQQASDTTENPPTVDPENKLLWKSPRKRLSWEQTRDAIIHATGELDPTPTGSSFNINQPWIPRRSVFAYINRLDVPTLLRTFDYPSPDASAGSRSQTTVPQQALWFFNNPFVRQAATKIAARTDFQSLESEAERVEYLFMLLYSRPPDDTELAAVSTFLASQPGEAAAVELIQVLLMSNEFVYVN